VCMLTRLKLKRGGVLEEFNPKIGSRSRCSFPKQRVENHYETNKAFLEAFLSLKVMVEEMYENQNKFKEESTLKTDGKCKGLGGGGDPPEPPLSPYSSFPGSSSITTSRKKQPPQDKFELPLLKLDVKFKLPIYNGDLDA